MFLLRAVSRFHIFNRTEINSILRSAIADRKIEIDFSTYTAFGLCIQILRQSLEKLSIPHLLMFAL